MTADLDPARRLVACKHFRWTAGSQSVWTQSPEHGGNTIRFRATTGRPHNDPWFQPERGRWELVGPDLTDPATVGCLLALVREAYGRPDLHACPMFSYHTGDLVRWRVALDEHTAHYGPTEPAALVAALEAAP